MRVRSARTGRVAVEMMLAGLVIGEGPGEGIGIDAVSFHIENYSRLHYKYVNL